MKQQAIFAALVMLSWTAWSGRAQADSLSPSLEKMLKATADTSSRQRAVVVDDVPTPDVSATKLENVRDFFRRATSSFGLPQGAVTVKQVEGQSVLLEYDRVKLESSSLRSKTPLLFKVPDARGPLSPTMHPNTVQARAQLEYSTSIDAWERPSLTISIRSGVAFVAEAFRAETLPVSVSFASGNIRAQRRDLVCR
jgi:hypothetical protein